MARRKKPVIPDELLDQLLAGRSPRTVFEKDGIFDELKRTIAERPFGRMKTKHGYVRVRYRGRARNHCHFNLMATAMNLCRGLTLWKAQARCV